MQFLNIIRIERTIKKQYKIRAKVICVLDQIIFVLKEYFWCHLFADSAF